MARRNERRLIAADYECCVHRLANTRTHHASFASDSAAFSLASKIFSLKSLLPLPMNRRERVFMERLDDVKPTR
jgi:hypothetical protein